MHLLEEIPFVGCLSPVNWQEARSKLLLIVLLYVSAILGVEGGCVLWHELLGGARSHPQ